MHGNSRCGYLFTSKFSLKSFRDLRFISFLSVLEFSTFSGFILLGMLAIPSSVNIMNFVSENDMWWAVVIRFNDGTKTRYELRAESYPRCTAGTALGEIFD